MNKREKLTEHDRGEIFDYIVFLALLASKNKGKPLRRFYERKLSDALWDWTASGYSRTGEWMNDAFKYCPETHICSVASQGAGKQLRHEHAVPRKVVVQMIIARASNAIDMRRLLDRLCVAALVTKDEDIELNKQGLRSKMPNGWRETDDPYARYSKCGIELVPRAGK